MRVLCVGRVGSKIIISGRYPLHAEILRPVERRPGLFSLPYCCSVHADAAGYLYYGGSEPEILHGITIYDINAAHTRRQPCGRSRRAATARCKCSMRAGLQNRSGGASRPRRLPSVQRPPTRFLNAHGDLHFVRGEVSFIPNADGCVVA